MKKIAICVIVLLLSHELFAQGKIFLEPYLGTFVGFSKENRSVNNKQNIISHNYFGSKDLVAGGKISYKNNKHKVSIGYETSYYSSNYRHRETGLPRVEGRYSHGDGPFNSIYGEYAKQLIDF